MFNLLTAAALLLFITHVALLIASFTGSSFATSRYFYSHLTLWLTGGVIFTAALLYSGTNQSGFLDYFSTPLRKGMILVATFAISLVAHSIVTFGVLPLIRKSKNF